MMRIAEALEAFRPHRENAIVVPGRGGRYWVEQTDNQNLDVPLGDPAMGGHAGFALGLALARPERQLVLFDSEGDILMSLGMLATIAEQAPANFYHFLLDNEVYATTGGQPVPNAKHVAYDKLALAAGSDGFIHKPFTVRGLLQTVAWHVSAREAGALSRSSRKSVPADRPAPVDAAWQTPPAAARQSAASNLFGGFMKMSRSMIMSGILVVAVVASASAQTATTLSATLGAPAGAASAGIKALGTVAVDVVTGITKLNASGLALSYQLDATSAAGVITSTTRVVTYTITGGV